MTYEEAVQALNKISTVYHHGDMKSDFYIVCIKSFVGRDECFHTARITDGEQVEEIDIRHLSLFPSEQLTYDLNVPELIMSKEASQRLAELEKRGIFDNFKKQYDNFKKQKEMEQQKSSYTAEQFAIMNRLDGKEVKDTITGFTGKVTGFAVYPEYEGKYVNVMIGKQTDTGDFIERWIWNTRLEVIE